LVFLHIFSFFFGGGSALARVAVIHTIPTAVVSTSHGFAFLNGSFKAVTSCH
jgi:hypothetical protein